MRLTTRLFVPFVMTVVSDATPELGLDIARLLGPFFLGPSTNQIFSGHAPSAHANSPLRRSETRSKMRRLPRAAACPTWPVVFLERWASDRSDRILIVQSGVVRLACRRRPQGRTTCRDQARDRKPSNGTRPLRYETENGRNPRHCRPS